MEKNNLLNLIDNFQEVVLYILPAVTVLLFLPITSEFFEFNKMIAVLIISSLALIVWAIKTVKTQKLSLVKSPLDLGMGLLILSVILSTIFSNNKFYSLFGQQGKFFPNIFISILLFFLYYTITANISSKRVIINTIKSLVVSTSLASLIGILSYFNITEKLLPFDWVKGLGFNTLGSPTTLGIIAAASFGAAIALLAEAVMSKNRVGLFIYSISSLLTGIYILSTNNLPTWIVAIISLTFVVLNVYFNDSKELFKSKIGNTVFLSLLSILLLFAIVNYVPSISSSMGINYTKTTEITLDSKTSWQIATSALRDYPLLGSGVATYVMDFTAYKPLSFNSGDFWNLRFNKPSNEFFRILSEQGLLGLGALIILIISVAKILIKSQKSKGDLISISIGAGLMGILSSLFFYSANTAIATLTVLLLALLIGIQKEFKEGDIEEVTLSVSAMSERLSLNIGSVKRELLTYVFMGLVLLITIPTLFASTKAYAAEVYRRKALVAAEKGNIGESYNLYNKIIQNNPFYDTYRRDFANIDIALVALIAQKGEDITEQDKSDMQQLVNQATREVRLTTEKINPLYVANWEHRAWVFNQLIALDPNAAQAAMDAAQTAVQLDPLNPILRVGSGSIVGTGSIYYSAGDFQRAAISFAEAIQLKSDFANAYYNLSLSQAQLKAWEASATNMEIVLRLLPQDSEDFKIASDNLKVLKEQAEKEREDLAKQQQEQQPVQEEIVEEQPIQNNEVPAGTEGSTQPQL